MESGLCVIAGGTGFIGRHFAARLLQTSIPVRVLGRSVADSDEGRFSSRQADMFSLLQVERAMEGATTAVYLIHSMESRNRLTQGGFQDIDLIAADNFARAARSAGVRRIVYLGGLLPGNREDLSAHLRSRREVEIVLAGYGIQVVAVRAGLVIGAGGSSYRIVTRLVNRLPLMVVPAWTATETQPVSLPDILDALEKSLNLPWENLPAQRDTDSRENLIVLNAGCRESITYADLMRKVAEISGKQLFLLTVPLNSKNLSTLWVRLFSGETKNLVDPLVESLSYDMLAVPNSLPVLLGRNPDSPEQMVRKASAEVYPSVVTKRVAVKDRTVRSVQRVKFHGSAWDLSKRYFTWLRRALPYPLKVHSGGENISIGAGEKVLLHLEYSADRSDSDRALYYIRDGLLVAESSGNGRFEFRKLPLHNEALIAIHDFVPALNWGLYSMTQALIHLMVMNAFANYLENGTPASHGP